MRRMRRNKCDGRWDKMKDLKLMVLENGTMSQDFSLCTSTRILEPSGMQQTENLTSKGILNITLPS